MQPALTLCPCYCGQKAMVRCAVQNKVVSCRLRTSASMPSSRALTLWLVKKGCTAALQAETFAPMIFIDSVLQGGGSLMLPAALAPDRWSLLTQMPLEGGPLVAGNHTVMISLNGQQLPEQLEYSEAAVSFSSQGT